MYLAQNLRYLRNQNEMKQDEFAHVFGVSGAAVSNWEAGNREPELSTLVSIADFFNITLDVLVLKDLRPPKPMYAKNLKFLREKYEMTQEEMAKLLGLKDKSSC